MRGKGAAQGARNGQGYVWCCEEAVSSPQCREQGGVCGLGTGGRRVWTHAGSAPRPPAACPLQAGLRGHKKVGTPPQHDTRTQVIFPGGLSRATDPVGSQSDENSAVTVIPAGPQPGSDTRECSVLA